MIRRSTPIHILLIITMLAGSTAKVLPQARIQGTIPVDTFWKPVVYLSEIPDLSQLYSISFSNIVDSSVMENDHFSFSSKALPVNDQLYRIHLSKKGDPPASLIIGGKNQNHFFLIAKREVDIHIQSSPGLYLFNNLRISGYEPNNRLMEITSITGLLDTMNFFGSPFSREYVHEAVKKELKHYADTCSNTLVSKYAAYLAGADESSKPYYWIGLFIIIILFLLIIFPKIWKKKKSEASAISHLTIQERRVYRLLQNGKSNKEIADECSISVSTVKSHVNNIYSKLGVNSRREILDHSD